MGVVKAALESSIKYLSIDLGKKNIRINAISPNAIKTVSAMSIKSFKQLARSASNEILLTRDINIRDIGKIAVMVTSELSNSITGEIIFANSGISNIK